MFKPRFAYSLATHERLRLIDAHRGEVEGLVRVPGCTGPLRGEARVRSVMHGTRVGRDAVEPGRAAGLVERNYDVALGFAEWVAGQPMAALDERFICDLNFLILNGASEHPPGIYRDGLSLVARKGGKAPFAPAVAAEVGRRVGELIEWLAGPRPHPVLAAAIAHAEVLGIRPFWDGNGRTARVLGGSILERLGYGFGGMIAVEAGCDLDRERYFAALEDTFGDVYSPGRADFTTAVDFYVEAVASETGMLVAKLQGFQNLHAELYQRLGVHGAGGGTAGRSVAVVLNVAVRGQTSTSAIMEDFGLSRSTAVRILRDLEEIELLSRRGRGRNCHYVHGAGWPGSGG